MTPASKLRKDIYKILKNRYLVFNLIEVKPSGIPDLMVIDPANGEHTYIEIKAEGDRLRPNQEYMIDKMRTAKCKVYVVKDIDRVKEIFGLNSKD